MRLTPLRIVLNTTFGGTILEAPIQTFAYCILGSKVDNLEKGLAWVHDNARVTFPTIPLDALMLSSGTMNRLVAPISQAAAGGGSNGDDGVIGTIFDRYLRQLRMERLIAGLFIAAWGLVVLVGIAILLWHSRLADVVMKRRLVYIGHGSAGSGLRNHGLNNREEKQYSEDSYKAYPTARAQTPQHYRPTLPHAASGWSGRVRGAVNSMLKVPGDTVRQSFLNRKPSQKSDRSWLAPAGSPWSEKPAGSSDMGGATRASSPVKLLPPSRNWTAAYPHSQESRYPSVTSRLAPAPIAVAQEPWRADSPSESEDDDDGERTPLSSSYRPNHSRQPIQQEYFDTQRHPRQYSRSPFVTPFDDSQEQR